MWLPYCIKALIRIKPHILKHYATTKENTIKSRACTGSAQSSSLISSASHSISNIDDAIVYNTIRAHAAEVRGGTFRRALEAV